MKRVTSGIGGLQRGYTSRSGRHNHPSLQSRPHLQGLRSSPLSGEHTSLLSQEVLSPTFHSQLNHDGPWQPILPSIAPAAPVALSVCGMPSLLRGESSVGPQSHHQAMGLCWPKLMAEWPEPVLGPVIVPLEKALKRSRERDLSSRQWVLDIYDRKGFQHVSDIEAQRFN